MNTKQITEGLRTIGITRKEVSGNIAFIINTNVFETERNILGGLMSALGYSITGSEGYSYPEIGVKLANDIIVYTDMPWEKWRELNKQ